MRSAGMIAEFNPLHNGHLYALKQARTRTGADAVVVVMAGNFVQRGEPALVDKWRRTQMALAAGADVVVELPVHSVLQASEQYAAGGIQILAALGVDTLVFGTENARLDYLALAKERMQANKTAVFKDYTRTYASQLTDYYAKEVGAKLTAPNQMLGLAYAKAIIEQNARMKLLPIERVGTQHDAATLTPGFSSASAVRQALVTGQDVRGLLPKSSTELLTDVEFATWQKLWPYLRYRLLTATLPELQAIDQMTEGLENRLVQCVDGSDSFEDFLARVKSKRYTYARLRRLALATVLNVRHADILTAREQPYVHVLGFTTAGREYLHAIKKTATLPVITKVSHDMLAPTGIMALTNRTDRLYAQLMHLPEQNFGRQPLINA